jgi:hypothetical protein
MARKSSKKAQRPEKPGRFIQGHGDDESSEETIAFAIDDKQLRKIADELKELGARITEKNEAIKEAKAELAPNLSRHKLLVQALALGTLEERLEVFMFADDAAGTVAMYDRKTHELLGTRELRHWERQESMDFDDDLDEAEEEVGAAE